MLSTLTPTDVAYLMVALMQAIAAVLWWISGKMIGDSRRAAAWWCAFAVCSTLSFLFLVAAMRTHEVEPPLVLRAVGNVFNMLAIVTLQRGVWQFIGRPASYRGHGVAIAVLAVVSWFGLDPAYGPLRVGAICAMLAVMLFSITRDMYVYGRDTLRLRWPWLFAAPPALAAASFVSRSARAVFAPESVLIELAGDSTINVTSAFLYVLLTLSLHGMLMVLVISRMLADLRRLSRRDGLTGLLNRRALEETLADQMQRSRRSSEPFCVMMVDVDHFKNINDRFGHAVGDSALKQLAALMQKHMREVDRVGRFGGEEFVVLAPGLELVQAMVVAERLRAYIAATPLHHAGGSVGLSVSIGIAQWAGEEEDVSRLLRRADEALYVAKEQGRDRVEPSGFAQLAA
jgi:diguanylate cyclase (GGDEF)-like protein